MDSDVPSSQELISISVYHSSKQIPESDDEWRPSTQEINNIHTQEASNASDFFDNLRESQITTTDSLFLQSNENKIKNEDLETLSIDSFLDDKPSVEKKKRGRKRKVRTPEEMEIHLKEKKEKNRLAAQRLRQKKCTEVQKYDKEVLQLEANVRAKRQFAELIESNVNQLRNKIKIMFGNKTLTNQLVGSSDEVIDIKPIIESTSNINETLKAIVSNHNSEQNQFNIEITDFDTIDASKYLFCVSRL